MWEFQLRGIEDLERLNRRALSPRRKNMRKLQLTLGDAHDFVLLQNRLGRESAPDRQLLQRADMLKEQLYADAVGYGQKTFAVSVDDLVADMGFDSAAGRFDFR